MAQDLLSELRERGIKLRLAEGRLDVVAPQGTLTDELRERLRAQRDELVALLGRATVDTSQPELEARPEHRHEPFPLTDIQHAYWVGRGSAMELGGVSCHFYFELDSQGLELDRLTASLRKVIDRHDMMRAVVASDGRQRVLPEVPGYQIAANDLRTVPGQARAEALMATRSELDHQVLPTDRWPLFDIRASLLPDAGIRLHISLDVLILDGASVYLLFQDWRRFYQEPDWSPEPLELSYRDYVLFEEAARAGSRYKAAERYWLDRLDSLPPAPALPLAIQPSQLDRPTFSRRQARLSAARWSVLKQTAQVRGITASAVLLAAFADVLRLWSAQPACTVNLTLFNRPSVHPQIAQLTGDFTSVTLLGIESRLDQPFARRAELIAQQVLRDLEHSNYSGVQVLRERGRRLGGGPGAAMPVVFTSTLVLGSTEDDPAAGIRFFGEQVYGISQTPQVWLDHQVGEVGGELVYSWDAVDDLFPAGVLDDMFAAYAEVLDRLGLDPIAWEQVGTVSGLPRWQLAERVGSNDTAAAIPESTLGELVEAQAAQRPDELAVIAVDGQLTYREVVGHARRLARRLLVLGAARDTLVAVVVDKGWQQVPAVLGVSLSGAGYLPIDPRWPQARRWQLLEQGGGRLVVTTAELRDELAWPDGIEVVTLDDAEVREGDDGPLDTVPAPGDLAYVIFTSGSTGRPKGVAIDHRGAANTVRDINHRFQVGPGDRVLALSALSFDLSVYDIFGILAAGGVAVLPAAHGTQDPAHWSDLVGRHGVTVWNSVPALMQAWMDALRQTGDTPVAKLRLVLLSGDWIPVSLPDTIRGRYPQAEVISLGGATEASIWSVCYPIGEVPTNWVRVPYGRPLANQTMYVYDDRLAPCPVWTTGEIYIGGIGVAQGYWGDAERTAERFVVHPETNERLYRTGDLGRFLPGGDIEFLGRQDSQVKLNGYRIELDEVAAALRGQPGVTEAIVGVDGNPKTGRRQLVAHVVPADGQSGPAGAGHDASWQPTLDGGVAALTQGTAILTAELARYQDEWRAVEALCPSIMARTLAQLGLYPADGETARAEDAVLRGGVKHGYLRLVRQWMAVLAGAGMLTPAGAAGYRAERAFAIEELDAVVRQGFDGLGGYRDPDPLLAYIVECADRQLGLLRGEVSPLELLLPGGDSRVTEALYATNPLARLQNQVAAGVVRAFVAALPTGQPVRVLEVGAGTGATSAHVLAELPPDRSRYWFTDVSRYFTERARSTFAGYPFVEYRTYDIDRDPAGQGFSPGGLDLILAANVLHDAKDIDLTLAHLRSALVPGGLLVLVEGTVNSLVQMITVGFIEGLAQDREDDRLPLLSVPQWCERVNAAGFTRFAAIPGEPTVANSHAQHVLLGAAPAGQPIVDADSLRTSLAHLLPDYMVPRHILFVDDLPLTANGKVDRSALPSPWGDTALDDRVEARDATESRLFVIWREALERDDFGIEDNFFELGGDSLHAVTILGRLREEFGLRATAEEGLEFLFDNPTIAELAVALRAMEA